MGKCLVLLQFDLPCLLILMRSLSISEQKQRKSRFGIGTGGSGEERGGEEGRELWLECKINKYALLFI